MSKKAKEGSHKYKYYVFSKQGFRQTSMNVNTDQNVKFNREGYNVMVGFKRMRHTLFNFYECHTHLLATPRKHYLF